ncbi:MAG: hypothetical protein QOI53_3438, partial [Verrucomicrobiota bacterium]|nr:hypothetical protein [Verrucomicrobiota bacterium]
EGPAGARSNRGANGPKGHERIEAQVLAWATFLGPSGPGTGDKRSADTFLSQAPRNRLRLGAIQIGEGPVGARSNGGVNGPKGHESIEAQVLAWATFLDPSGPGTGDKRSADTFLSQAPRNRLRLGAIQIGEGPAGARSNGGVNGPKGHESLAQALAWVTSKKRVSPVGAKENGISRSPPGRAFICEGSSGDILFWRRQANLIASKGMLLTNGVGATRRLTPEGRLTLGCQPP